jgi:putative membrane-bound dehydrogenase-like protein
MSAVRWLSLTLTLVLSPLASAQKEFGFDNRKGSGQPYLSPAETVSRMKPAEGFEVKLFAAEPQLVNPIAMTVDEKGRVWVVECFEYPKRTPKGKMPRDRVKILEDTDGDGTCDKVTTFIEGKDFPVPFDLASGIEVGNGGVYLGAPPYLFFIENKNDKPGKIDILLKGFGSQDTHETLNTFQWSPDGALYGLHGVFTYSEVTPVQADGPAVRMNAAVWRYDTKTKKFEVFSEGTSNPWGMDWRNTDGEFILCCCVIPHLFHMVPGGNYKRQGGLPSNPYTYGEIKEICDHTFHRESGWAHAGLVSLDTPIMPEKYRNSVVFGSIHGCSIKQNILKPNGSSFTASRGDDFLVSGDKNFRPINLRWGHNGEIYCIDWHDQNPCHQTKPDDWDYERGRVYRLQTKGLKTKKAEDIGAKTDAELLDVLEEENPYRYRTALRLMSERRDHDWEKVIGGRWAYGGDKFDWAKRIRTAVPVNHAASLLKAKTNYANLTDFELKQLAYSFDFAMTGEEFNAPIEPAKDPQSQFFRPLLVNLARHLAEQPKLDPRIVKDILPRVAAGTRMPELRRTLSSAAIRIDGDTLPLVRALMSRKEDAKDPLIPQLVWIAYEKQLTSRVGTELDWLKQNAAGNALISDTIVPRTLRRLVATGKAEDLAACVAFVAELKETNTRVKALDALVSAIGNRQVDEPKEWKAVRDRLTKDESADVRRLANSLAVKFADAEAVKRALAVAVDAAKSLNERASAVRDLGVAKSPATLKPLTDIARGNNAPELRAEAIRALAGFDAPQLAKDLLADWAKYPLTLKGEIVQVLSGRKDWAGELLAAVKAKKVERTDLNDNTILRIQALKDARLNAEVEAVWGRFRATPAELTALIDKMRDELAKAPGSFARGKVVFDNQCAKCHKFDGRGHDVGPNLDGAGRDIEYLLANVLDPNRVIGAPYFMRTVNTLKGTVETGVLHAEDEQSITLKGENAQLKQIQKKDIDEIRVQEKSLMPEGLGYNLSVQDFRDLVRYVMANPFVQADHAIFGPVDKSTGEPEQVSLGTGVSGRIVLRNADRRTQAMVQAKVVAPADLKVRLLIGSRNDVQVRVNGAPAKTARGSGAAAIPDQGAMEVELKAGENTVVVFTEYQGKAESLYLRFHDPDRKLKYPEPSLPDKE